MWDEIAINGRCAKDLLFWKLLPVLCTHTCGPDPKFVGHWHATVSCRVIGGSHACISPVRPELKIDKSIVNDIHKIVQVSFSFGQYKFLPALAIFDFLTQFCWVLHLQCTRKTLKEKKEVTGKKGQKADIRGRQEFADWGFWMCRVKENLLTQTANTIVNALQLNCRVKQGLFLILGCLKLGGLAIKRSAMKKFINAISQIKVNFSLASVLLAWIYPYIHLPLWRDYCNWSK